MTSPSFQGAQPPAGQPPESNAQQPLGAQQDPENMANLELVRGIVRNTRLLAQKVPAAVDIVRQINDLTQKLQLKLMQSGPGPQPQAPPIA